MYIEDIIWRDDVIEKLERKHHISPEEVEIVSARDMDRKERNLYAKK